MFFTCPSVRPFVTVFSTRYFDNGWTDFAATCHKWSRNDKLLGSLEQRTRSQTPKLDFERVGFLIPSVSFDFAMLCRPHILYTAIRWVVLCSTSRFYCVLGAWMRSRSQIALTVLGNVSTRSWVPSAAPAAGRPHWRWATHSSTLLRALRVLRITRLRYEVYFYDVSINRLAVWLPCARSAYAHGWC